MNTINTRRIAGECKMAIREIEREEIKKIMREYCQHECFKDQISEDELFYKVGSKMAFYEMVIERHFEPYLKIEE